MPEDKQETEVIEDVQTDEVIDTPDDVKADGRISTEDKDSPDSVIGWIGKKLRVGEKAGPDNFQDELDSQEIDDSDEISDNIPDEFTTAARDAGWTDKQIEDFSADYKDEDLLEMLPQLNARLEELQELDSQEQAVESEQEDKSTAPDKESDDKFEQFREELKKEYDEKFSRVEAGLRKEAEEREAQTVTDREQRANEIFDETSKDFPVFGKTEDLPKFPNGEFIKSAPAFKARNDVFGVATLFLQSGKSQNMTDAMKHALSWYKGMNLEKDVERKLIKRYKKGEKRLSAKRTAKDVTKTYEHPEDEKADIVEGIAKGLGVNLET